MRQGAAPCTDAVDHLAVGADARAPEQRHDAAHGDGDGAGRYARAERHDGAVTTSLGRVDPVEVQTTNGIAITTFFAGPNSGIADIRATSGAAKAEGDINLVKITIGAAAVNTVTVRANPGSIGPNGGTVELIATVVGENGQALEGVVVTFNADQGSLGSTTAVTNSSGEARTTLTTSQQTIVTATAGTKTSANLTIAARAGPVVTITCATVGRRGNLFFACRQAGRTTTRR